MIQDLLTYLLIASATAYILFSLYRMIYPSKKSQSMSCPGCSGCNHDNIPEKNNVEMGFKPFSTVVSEKDQTKSKISHPRSYSSDSGSVPAAGADKEWVPRDFASSDLANRLQ
jgi:hypothetical protein